MIEKQNTERSENSTVFIDEMEFTDSENMRFIEESSNEMLSSHIIYIESSTEDAASEENYESSSFTDEIAYASGYDPFTGFYYSGNNEGDSYRYSNIEELDEYYILSDEISESSTESTSSDYNDLTIDNSLLDSSDPAQYNIEDNSTSVNSDLIVLSSTDANHRQERISQQLITMIVSRIYMAYNQSEYNLSLREEMEIYPYSRTKIADKIRGMTDEEMEILKSKVKSILMIDIRDPLVLQKLLDLIAIDKIDAIGLTSIMRNKLSSTQYRNMIDQSARSCGICYIDFKPLHKCTSLQCWHTFHTKCIKKWISVTWCCPICRRKDIQ